MLAMPIGSVNFDLLVELELTVTPEGMPPYAATMPEITRKPYRSSTGQGQRILAGPPCVVNLRQAAEDSLGSGPVRVATLRSDERSCFSERTRGPPPLSAGCSRRRRIARR